MDTMDTMEALQAGPITLALRSDRFRHAFHAEVDARLVWLGYEKAGEMLVLSSRWESPGGCETTSEVGAPCVTFESVGSDDLVQAAPDP
jgi:hypothetical protein